MSSELQSVDAPSGERFKVVCIPCKASYKCSALLYLFTNVASVGNFADMCNSVFQEDVNNMSFVVHQDSGKKSNIISKMNELNLHLEQADRQFTKDQHRKQV